MSLYDIGFSDGLAAFAWWKDGKQCVGTMGKTLAEAQLRLQDCYGYSAPKPGDEDVLEGYSIGDLVELIDAARRVAKAKQGRLLDTSGGCSCHISPPCNFCTEGGREEIP